MSRGWHNNPGHNPGSDAARHKGCTCPVLDNNRGLVAPYPPDGWWITEGCPVHTAPIAASSSEPDHRPSASSTNDAAQPGTDTRGIAAVPGSISTVVPGAGTTQQRPPANPTAPGTPSTEGSA